MPKCLISDTKRGSWAWFDMQPDSSSAQLYRVFEDVCIIVISILDTQSRVTELSFGQCDGLRLVGPTYGITAVIIVK